mgnify:CR=1 FL=1
MAIKLSIICPVYKVAEYIPELLNSLILGANDKSVEFIFVNDACPDGSMDLCLEVLSNRKSEIKFSFQFFNLEKNSGQAFARNVALSKAQGEYVGFLDSDDLISKKYWSVLSVEMNSGDQDIIEFGFQEFSGLPPTDQQIAPVKNILSSEINPFITGFFVWTRVYKRELLKGLTFPEGMIYEDVYFNVLAFSKANSIGFVSKCLVFYRKREGSTTASRSSNYSQLLENLIKSVRQVISKSGVRHLLMLELSKRCLLIVLKGINIKESKERIKFYSNCSPLLKEAARMNSDYGEGFMGVSGALYITCANTTLKVLSLMARLKK